MKIVATMPMRNEQCFIGLTLRALLMWVDEVVLLDHASEDRSAEICRAIAEEHPGRLHVLSEDHPEWQEMRHRQRLLELARWLGATHIAMVDADEVLTGNLLGSIRDIFATLKPGHVLKLPWICLARELDRYYASGPWSGAWVDCGFGDTPAAHWAARNGYDFHHRPPMGGAWQPLLKGSQPVEQFGAGLMHLQFLDARRLRAKQALYKMTEVLRWPGREPVSVVDARYNHAVYGSDPTKQKRGVVDLASWWSPYADLMDHLDLSIAPWQEAECRRLWMEYPGRFTGLDLFGVAA